MKAVLGSKLSPYVLEPLDAFCVPCLYKHTNTCTNTYICTSLSMCVYTYTHCRVMKSTVAEMVLPDVTLTLMADCEVPQLGN